MINLIYIYFFEVQRRENSKSSSLMESQQLSIVFYQHKVEDWALGHSCKIFYFATNSIKQVDIAICAAQIKINHILMGPYFNNINAIVGFGVS